MAATAPADSPSKHESEAGLPALKKGWNLLHDLRPRLAPHLRPEKLDPTWSDPRRTFRADDYLCLLFLGLFNPTVRTLRGLCAASRLEATHLQWGCGPMSLGSVSEAQSLLDPELLRPLIAQLVADVRTQQQQAGTIPSPQKAHAAAYAPFTLRPLYPTRHRQHSHRRPPAHGLGRLRWRCLRPPQQRCALPPEL